MLIGPPQPVFDATPGGPKPVTFVALFGKFLQSILVGECDGASVGDADGASVGDFVGESEGETEGASVGDVDGASVGACVGAHGPCGKSFAYFLTHSPHASPLSPLMQQLSHTVHWSFVGPGSQTSFPVGELVGVGLGIGVGKVVGNSPPHSSTTQAVHSVPMRCERQHDSQTLQFA